MFYSVLVTITLRLLYAECLQGLQGVDIFDVDEFTHYAYLYYFPPSLAYWF